MSKSSTDNHWNERAIREQNSSIVNIADVSQRELETNFLLRHLKHGDHILEVGCGNGFLTNILREQVAHVDAFDYSENMVTQAITQQGEKNNRFFHDNVLKPSKWQGPYDVIVCIRVLINLRDVSEQKHAIDNMCKGLKPGGRLLLVEGYIDGFCEINRLREKVGIERLKPAEINYYSPLAEVRSYIDQHFISIDTFHTGSFDFLTRVVYPALVGSQIATGHSDFHQKILGIANAFNPDAFASLARLHGFALLKRH